MARNFNATRQDSPARSHLTRRGVLRMTAGGGIASLAVPSLSGPATAQEGGEEHWRFETDERIRSSPTIVDGTVFLGSDDGNLYALSEDTGDEQWRFTTNGYVTGAPAVVDGLAFIGSWDNTLYAVETDTGEEVWRVDTDGNVSSAPTVVNQTVFVNAQEYLFAFDAATGEEQWYDEISASGTTTCSAVTEHDLVFAGVEHGVGGRSADAGELRAYTLEEGTREISNELGTGITTAPTVDDGLVFAGAQLGANSFGFYAIDAESGTEEWEFEIEDGFSASPTVAEGTVYVGSGGGKLYALDAQSGEERWDFEAEDTISGSPTVADGTVFVGSRDHTLYALDAETGELKWNYETDHVVTSAPTVANGTVYVGSEDGNLYALDAGIDGSSTGSRVQLGTYGHHGEWQYADQSISRGTVDAEKESEGGPSAVAPGFSVGGTLTALGGVGYLLKRRLADSEND